MVYFNKTWRQVTGARPRAQGFLFLKIVLFCLCSTFSTLAYASVTVTTSQVFDLCEGQSVRLLETQLEITALEIISADQKCQDCPIGALLRVRMGANESTLKYRISGNMPDQAHYKAKRKSAYGYLFIVQKITNKTVTLQVIPADR